VKAVGVFPGKKEFGLIDHPAPSLAGPGDVKLRMLEVGVCGTDKEITSFEYGTAPPGFDYFVLGHESLGEVVETGPSVSRLKVGDLVVGTVRHPCDRAECTACRSGRQDFCITGDYRERGIKDMHGFMTEFVVDNEQYLNVVPRELREVAVLVEPLTIAEKALIQVAQIQKRLPWGCPPEHDPASGYCHRAVVLGAGPVGLLGAMLLVIAGFRTWVYSRSRTPNRKAAIVEAIGATYISSEELDTESMAREAGPIDLVYEATGAAQLAFDVLKSLGPNGVFVLTGVPSHGRPVELDTDTIMRNLVLQNQIVLGTVNAGKAAFEGAIRDLSTFNRRWPQQLRALITGRYPLEQFREPVSGEAGGIKNIIELDGKA
jgi:glucose 1-dehydrogenase